MSSNEMYADEPTIASDPIYVGPSDEMPELDDDVERIRIWDDVTGGWIDNLWSRNGTTVEFKDWPVGDPIRVVEMVPVDEHEGKTDYEE